MRLEILLQCYLYLLWKFGLLKANHSFCPGEMLLANRAMVAFGGLGAPMLILLIKINMQKNHTTGKPNSVSGPPVSTSSVMAVKEGVKLRTLRLPLGYS